MKEGMSDTEVPVEEKTFSYAGLTPVLLSFLACAIRLNTCGCFVFRHTVHEALHVLTQKKFSFR